MNFVCYEMLLFLNNAIKRAVCRNLQWSYAKTTDSKISSLIVWKTINEAMHTQKHCHADYYLPLHWWTYSRCQLDACSQSHNIEESRDSLPFCIKITQIAFFCKRRIYWQSCCPGRNHGHPLLSSPMKKGCKVGK